MSSQTTDTPGTTKPPTRDQDRSGATFQTYPINQIFANRRFRDFRSRSRPHPAQARSKARHFPGCYQGGRPPRFSAPGCLTRGDSEDITRPRPPAQITPIPTKTPANTGQTPPPRLETKQNPPKTAQVKPVTRPSPHQGLRSATHAHHRRRTLNPTRGK